MTKEDLVDILKRLLRTDADLSFLLRLTTNELETLVACTRERVDNNRC